MKKRLIYRILKATACTVAAVAAFAVILPIFVCDRFRIGGESMSPTLEAGDRILVNKLLMGARIYTSYDFSSPDVESFRMPGLRKIRPGDVVVFDYPYGQGRKKIEFRINYVYAKRCIGCPGDTVSIEDGYYRNGRCGDMVFGVADNQQELKETPDSALARMKGIWKAYPFSADYGWTIKDFGPMYIPGKGDRVAMDKNTVRLYGRMIEYETGTLPRVRKGRVYLGSQELREYVFMENWYFLGGDNVLNSKDSRYIGLVPEEYIVGIATTIMFSADPDYGRIRWNRIMKRI